MNGCNWQNKSFSVSLKETKVLDICSVCQSEINGVVYKHNGNTFCKDCFSKIPTLRKRLGISDFGFSTTKDKLYHFNHQFTLNEKPVEIRSKGHWRREIKKRGLTDDFDQKPKRPENLRTPVQDYKPVGKEFIRDEILKELQEKGLRDKLVRRRR